MKTYLLKYLLSCCPSNQAMAVKKMMRIGMVRQVWSRNTFFTITLKNHRLIVLLYIIIIFRLILTAAKTTVIFKNFSTKKKRNSNMFQTQQLLLNKKRCPDEVLLLTRSTGCPKRAPQ